MSAFDDVLTTEKEALQSIEKARTEVADAIASAKEDHKTKIANEVVKLEKQEAEALSLHESQVEEKTSKIKVETEAQVAVIEKKFSAIAEQTKEEIIKIFKG